jgi:hypothetical protein
MVPLAVVVLVVLLATSSTVGTIAFLVIVVACFSGLVGVRVQYLKNHPPDPELVHKPFWKF